MVYPLPFTRDWQKIEESHFIFSEWTGYALPEDLLHPLVCFDEKSIQLLAQTRAVAGCKPGKATRQDHEYKRNGTRNLFVLVAPKRGERNVFVTYCRTKIDFAQVMR